MKKALSFITLIIFLGCRTFQASNQDGRNPLVDIRATPIPTQCVLEGSEELSLKSNPTSIEVLNNYIKAEREKIAQAKQKKIAAEKYGQYHRILILWNCDRLLSHPNEEKSREAKYENIKTLQNVLDQAKKVVKDDKFSPKLEIDEVKVYQSQESLLKEELQAVDKMINPKWDRDYLCCQSVPGKEDVIRKMARLKQIIGNILKEEDNPKIKEFKKGLRLKDFLPRKRVHPAAQQAPVAQIIER